MLHYENTICKQGEHTLPLVLLYLGLAQKVIAWPLVHFVHPYQACREDNDSWDVHVEVVADTFDAIEVEDDQDIHAEAEDVDGNNSVPVHSTGKSTVHHHDQPRGERFI